MAPIDISKFEQLKASGDLPSPKGVAMAIVEMTLRDDVSLLELAHVIKADPAFVGRLIRASNGINALGRRPVVSVQDALALLGLPAVRALALGFSLMTSYSQGLCAAFKYREFWAYSLACAIATQAITAHTRVAMPEETFSAGLLARIGELALATLYPAAYSTVLEHHERYPDGDLDELEQSAFAMNHRELAAAMMTDWGIPKVYVDPVFHHERPDEAHFAEGSRYAVLTQTLELARYLASICMAAPVRRGGMMAKLFRLGSRLSMETDTLTALCDRVVHEWTDWGRLLDIDTKEVPPFAELNKPGPATQDSGVSVTNGQRVRVLVVDDDPALRAMLRAALEKHGNEVLEASDGRQGLEMALDVQPHMMIIDWVMPGMDGMELVLALRQTRVGRGMFIMILTAYEDDDRLIHAFENGVDDFMAKPLKPRVLTARLLAGQRIILLQHAIERDREEIRHFAAELAVSNRRLQEAALTDALTAFPNRRYGMERVQQEWSSSTRSQRPLAGMVIDIDEFKQINDTHGHDVGDTVLKEAAAMVKRALRAQDVVCRIGGDEFLVICPDTTHVAALACAERVRRAVEGAPIRAGRIVLHTSLSIGVAVRDPAMREPNALIKVADQGAYRAKQLGRNRVATVQLRAG